MVNALINPDVLKSVLAKNNLQASRSLGQNFLICEEVIDAVLIGLEGGPKHVTELGAGLGTLTQGLIGAGYTVRAIEKDDEFVKILPMMMPPKLRPRLTVVHGDLKEVEWPAALHPSESSGSSESWQLVGNIPYNLSGFIIRLLTKLPSAPYSAIFLMQKEVANRILMRDSSMSLLGLSVGLWGTATLLVRVPSSCFMPAPAVDSSLIMLRPLSDALPSDAREQIIAKAKPFFQAKRKQIGTILKRIYHKSEEEIDIITKQAGVLSTTRPEHMSVNNWIQLCDIL